MATKRKLPNDRKTHPIGHSKHFPGRVCCLESDTLTDLRSIAIDPTAADLRRPSDLIQRTTAGGYEILSLEPGGGYLFGWVRKPNGHKGYFSWDTKGAVSEAAEANLIAIGTKGLLQYALVFGMLESPDHA